MRRSLYLLFFSILLSFGQIDGQTMTELVFPQYLGGQLTTAFYIKIQGLAPSTSYKVAAGMVTLLDLATEGVNFATKPKGWGYFYFPEFNSGGVMLVAPRTKSTFYDASAYASIASNGDGEISTWVVIAAANITRFLPNNYDPTTSPLKLSVLLNDGTESTVLATRILSSSTVLVADQTGAANATSIDDCALINGSSGAPEGKYIAIYSNELGTGRPLHSYMVENNNLNEAGATSDPTYTYPVIAAWYTSDINSQAGKYGLLYPISANPNGIRRIEIFNSDGSSYEAITDADGVWPSGLNTTTFIVGNTYSVTESDAPFPVELVNFRAEFIQSQKTIKLTWQTATEINSYGFEIQKKSQNSAWTTIGEIPACGNSNSPKNYSFNDFMPNQGINYYRLKLIDNDGSYKFSVEISAAAESPTTFILNQNYPNPFNPSTTISYSLPENSFVTIKVYDILGKEVATLVNEEKPVGAYSVNFDGAELSSGTYIYILSSNGQKIGKKMTIIK